MKRKSIAVVIASMLAFTMIAGATLAYLQAESKEVTNTFTVGDIKIELKEHDAKADGSLYADAEHEVESRTGIKLTPGTTVAKDPFVRVKAKSEDCYVYVYVDNYLFTSATADAVIVTPIINTTYWEQIGDPKTVAASGNNPKYTRTLYRYKGGNSSGIVSYSETDQKLENVFSNVTISADLTNTTEINTYLNGKTIVLKAFAYQADGRTEAEATAAAKAWAGFNN